MGGIEPLRFDILHVIAQVKSVLLYLCSFVHVVNALMPDGAGCCGIDLLLSQIMFPSGCLIHHITFGLVGMKREDRMQSVLDYWLPQLLGCVESNLLEEVKSTLTGLINFVDSWLDSLPDEAFTNPNSYIPNP